MIKQTEILRVAQAAPSNADVVVTLKGHPDLGFSPVIKAEFAHQPDPRIVLTVDPFVEIDGAKPAEAPVAVGQPPFLRELKGHRVNGLNEAITIGVCDEPGPGGACHHYVLDLHAEPGGALGITGPGTTVIRFQKGPILEAGINGISIEALLVIIIDRLERFQAGPYACVENGMALDFCRGALEYLKMRTQARVAQGVEGRNMKHVGLDTLMTGNSGGPSQVVNIDLADSDRPMVDPTQPRAPLERAETLPPGEPGQ